MSDKTLINGWTINHGDYLRDPEYDDEFIKNKTQKKFTEKIIFSVSAIIAFSSFFGLMSLMSNLLK